MEMQMLVHIGLLCMYQMKLFTLIFFGVEHVPKEMKRFIRNKNIKTNLFRIQANYSITCGYFSIGFIDFTFANKTLIDFTSLLSPYDFKKNDNIILSYFK